MQLIGDTESIRAIRADIDCAARTDAKVLITGETGVGKEVVARLIHHRSPRSHSPMVTLNCAGLPDSLLESELFGHMRGSFTGAYRDKLGLLETAQGGTVFLDEVGEMSTRMQAVLLRFLETGEIQRLGADRAHGRINVRLVTATNRDLPEQITAGVFREDLYFRLNVVRICLPPLRERPDDIPVLVDHFLTVYSKQHHVQRGDMAPQTMDALVAYRWPGNIRELRNVVERLVLRATGSTIRPSDLPLEIRPGFATIAARTTASRESGSATSVADQLANQLLVQGESFWSTVYPQFMARDITRQDLRKIVSAGLENTNGNYRLLVQLFNMPPQDYKRFLSFLRKHDCHLPFQKFRAVPARIEAVAAKEAATA